MNLEIDLGGLVMKNPVTVASGTFGYGEEYDKYFDVSRLGALTTKSLTLKPRAGNKPPRLVETPAGMLNAIGLQNVGLDEYLSKKLPFLREKGVPIIANIYGYSPEEYAELASRLEKAGAADAIEANLSCPNVHDARIARGAALVAQDPEKVAEYTRVIRSATRLPLFVKLTPNVMNICEPALAAEEAGADAVSLINTLLGMAIDVRLRRAKLANCTGGLSGPAIKPVALRMVWQVWRALQPPIIGMGGIMTGEDAAEFMLAGAAAVAVGTANFVDPTSAERVGDELEAFCRAQGIAKVADLTGALEC